MLLTITDNDSSKELEYMDLFESYPVDGDHSEMSRQSFPCAQGKTEKVQSAIVVDRTADKRGQLYLP